MTFQQACLERKCCYKEVHDDGNTPWCYFPSSYRAYQLTKHTKNEFGHHLELSRHTPITYSNLFQKICIEIIYLSESSLRVRFNTSEEKLFVSPIKLDLPEFDQNTNTSYQVDVIDNVIYIHRKATNVLVWSADLNTLVMSEQFNQVFTGINSNLVMGLGEHKDVYEKVVKNRKQVLFFNRDEPPNPGNIVVYLFNN